MACGAPEHGLPQLVGHVSVGGGRVFLQVLVVLVATYQAEVVASGCRGTFGVVLSHALQTKEVGLLGPGFPAVDCCAVVADELQAEFIYEHVEGAKVVAGTRVGSVGIHDNVGVVLGPDEELHEEPARPGIVASRLVQAWDLVVLVHGSHVPEMRGKVRVPGGRTFRQNCVKRSRGANLPGVVHHKLWRGQLREPVPHTPVHSGRSPRVMVVAQEVDGLATLPGDGTQSSPAPEFVPAMFGQPPAEFLGVVLAAWHDGARGQDSQLVLQQVEERDGVVKAVHEQHVVLVGDRRVLHKPAENTAG